MAYERMNAKTMIIKECAFFNFQQSNVGLKISIHIQICDWKWNIGYASLYKICTQGFYIIIIDTCRILNAVIISMVFQANWSSIRGSGFRRAIFISIDFRIENLRVTGSNR